MRLSPEEALVAVTVNAAHAAGIGDQAGSLEPGKLGDIVIWRAKRHLPAPAVNSEEAPIMLMRRWYKQFYETA